jgi:hypothetical protein
MRFEWDEAKNLANLRKHGISFERAVAIFAGPVINWNDYRNDYGERRQISVGVLDGVLLVAVVHTDRAGKTRLISARTASRKERRTYVDTYPEALGP